MERQHSMKEVLDALQTATDIAEEVARRGLYEGREPLSFEQKIINAVRQMEEGNPMRDFLEPHEIEQAIKTLADIYMVTGVKMPEGWW